jgi:inosose dehydratase
MGKNMVTRRQFIQSSVGAACASALPAIAGGGGSGISLGFSLYGMKSVPLPEALRTCAAIGYRNVELTLMPGFPSQPGQLSSEVRKTLRRQLESQSLGVSALMLNLKLAADDKTHQQNLEDIKAAAELAHDLAPQRPPLIETVLGGKPSEWETTKEQLVARLQAWAEAAKRGKIILGLKAHMGNAVNTPERLLYLLEKAGGSALAAVFDYSHFQLQGIPLEEGLKSLLPRTRFIHVKDVEGDAGKYKFLLPGEGRIDYPAYFKLLKQLGYEGPVVAEVSAHVFNQPGYDPIAAARKCYATLSAALNRA